MYDEDDFDPEPRRRFPNVRNPGVSPAWRSAAIVALVAAALFLAGCVALSLTLLMEQQAPPARTAFAPAISGLPGPAGEEQVEELMDRQAAARGIYPLEADLVAPEPEAVRESVRARFLKEARKVATLPQTAAPLAPRVSPDGQYLVWVNEGDLEHQALNLPEGAGPVLDEGLAPLPGQSRSPIHGAPTWVMPGHRVFCTDADGNVVHYSGFPRVLLTTSFRGAAPAAVPDQPDRILFLRSRPVPLLATPGRPLPEDPTEVVLGELTSQEARVVVPAGPIRWESMTVSPDGKRLALVAAPGPQQPRQIYLCDLDPDKPGEPKPVGPANAGIGPIWWTRDGRSLIHERAVNPVPFDHAGEEARPFGYGRDLFQLDVADGKLIRLSRGGGFTLAGVGREDALFFLGDRSETGWNLYRLPLGSAQTFAAHEPEQPLPQKDAWQALLDQAMKAGGLAAAGDEQQLTPDQLTRVASAFTEGYAKLFRQEAPADVASWERLYRQLHILNFASSDRPFVLVLGAAEGEYLCRQYGATWHLTKGALVPRPVPGGQPELESPFAIAINPFELAGTAATEDMEHIFRYHLRKVHGRALLLVNDPAEGKRALASLADPDLERGSGLLRQGQAAAGEKLLLELVKRPKHARNDYLALEAARLLHEHGRTEALRQLLEALPEANGSDRKYRFNLKGLVLLEKDPRAAVVPFKDALRCDLTFGPAYLNLAQAYEKTGETESAQLCLKRLLRLMPYSPYAESARQRLAALDVPP